VLPAPERLPRAARRALAAVWLAFAGVVIVGLGGELWLRIEGQRAWKASERFRAGNLFYASGDAAISTRGVWAKPVHRYQPGARTEGVAGGQRYAIEINSLGYRTREFSPHKPPRTVRVLCLGSSTTVAGLTNDETYPALLEGKLRRRWPGLPVEVLNLGVSGVNSQHWLDWLEEALSFEPDVVVQYEGINDIAWIDLPGFAARHPWRRRLYESFFLERLLGLDPTQLDPEIQGTLERFAEMDRRCRERGVAYLTATFAAPDARRASEEFRRHLDANLSFWGRYFPLRSWETYAGLLARHNALLVEFANRRHINRVLVAEQLTDPDVFIDACHLTPLGIDRLADAFLPAVANLVSDRPAFREGQASHN
jgi:lysophospholipase L1-like esterase